MMEIRCQPSSPIHLYLFGSPRLEKDGHRIEIDTRKAIALMAYLALSEGQHRRDSLAALLWPEYDRTRARAALRRTLSALNKALCTDVLEIDRESVAVSPSGGLWCDAAAFKRLAETASPLARRLEPDCLYRGDENRAQDLAREALRLAETSLDRLAMSKPHNILGMLACGRDERVLALDHLERSQEFARNIAEPGAQIAALNNLALVHIGMGWLKKSIEYTQIALDLCLRLGDRHREAALRNNLADLYHKAGQADAAMDQL